MEELTQTVHYFIREGLWHTAYLACANASLAL